MCVCIFLRHPVVPAHVTLMSTTHSHLKYSGVLPNNKSGHVGRRRFSSLKKTAETKRKAKFCGGSVPGKRHAETSDLCHCSSELLVAVPLTIGHQIAPSTLTSAFSYILENIIRGQGNVNKYSICESEVKVNGNGIFNASQFMTGEFINGKWKSRDQIFMFQAELPYTRNRLPI